MTSVIIAAAGKSRRMNGADKQREKIEGIPIFVRSALAFDEAEEVLEIIVCAPKGESENFLKILKEHGVKKISAVVEGGETRFHSVKNALESLSENCELVAVHDGARPLIRPEEIKKVIADAKKFGAAIAASRVVDTIKISSENFIETTPPREKLFCAQTPQIFKKEIFLRCVKILSEKNIPEAEITDDASILELCGEKVFLTEIEGANFKITRPEDLAAARAIFAERKK